ncbi:TPA: hypothetical protein ACLAMH_002063, partial [Neisseria meningitidis]
MQHKPLPYQWGKFWNNTIKPEKQAMFFHSICQCIRFQYVSRIKMYSGLTKIKTRRRSRPPPEKRKKCRPKTFRTAFSRKPSFSQGQKTKNRNLKFVIPAFAGMTAAGCCFLFINFCSFEFQPSS